MRRDDEFGRALKEAGEAVTPGGSEEVHARVMGAVRRERAREGDLNPPAWVAGRGWTWWWGVVGAGVASVGVVVGVWVLNGRERVATRSVGPATAAVAVELPAVPSVAEIVAAARPVREKLKDARFAYLDRDGKRLAKFLLRSVPGVPEGVGAGKGQEEAGAAGRAGGEGESLR
jgi:hypothetical protein